MGVRHNKNQRMRIILVQIFLVIIILSCSKTNKSTEYKELKFSLYFADNKAGYFESSLNEDGSYQYVFEYNDRGRGPHLEESIWLNENGYTERLQIQGHNYLKDTVTEVFSLTESEAKWKSSSENGRIKPVDNSFYIGANSSYGNTELLIRRLLTIPNKSLNIYPEGNITINSIEHVQINDTLNLNLIELVGFSFTPDYYWFDMDNRFFAAPTTWLSAIRNGYEPVKAKLLEIQTTKEKEYYARAARELTEIPEGRVLISNVNIFDAENGAIIKNRYVLLNGNKIENILDNKTNLPEVTRIIDGTNKTLLPGLFDMHTHMDRSGGILNLAAGVTSARDMANSLDFPNIVKEFDNNSVIGPRILIMSGFIDKAGPYAGPSGKIVNSLDEGLDAIEFYNERGYQQIKLYSSIEPDWVKPLAEKTHQLGMRLSGHIPSFMHADQAIKDGYDEIQHINMIALNFMSDTIDTRTPLRFSMIGEQVHTIDLEGDDFLKFVKILKDRNIVIDATVSFFEGMLGSKAGEPDPQFANILDRLPIQVKRQYYNGGLPIPAGKEKQYKDSFDKLLEMIKVLHENGVTIVPGTDALLGFGLHKELENYVRAGIPTSDVLRMATIISAQVTGHADHLGSIEVGKLADVILVDGNPLEDISDIRRVELTIKNGNIYDARTMYKTLGTKYFK